MEHAKKLSILSQTEGMKQGLSRELIYAWNQIVLRERFTDTPVGFSDDTEKQQAILDWEHQREEYRQSQEYFLQSSVLPKCEYFVGRQRELSAIEAAFSDNSKTTKLLIHGMGGIGKTTLVRQAAERLKKQYDKVLWLSYRGDFVRTICDDGQLKIKNLSRSVERCKNQNNYFKEKWEILCNLMSQEKVLLILDDMNDAKARKLQLLQELPCDVLVTGRIFPQNWPAAEFTLEALQSEEDWQKFYAGYSAEKITSLREEQLTAYRKTVQGNTLLMRLAVCEPDLCLKPENGMESYFLRTNALTATDVQILRYLSILPVDGIEVHRFLAAAGLTEKSLQRLTELSLVWVYQHEDNRICGLHPVIAESVRSIYKPMPENCMRFLNGLALYYTDIWNQPYTEVQKAIPICFALLQTWPKIRAWLADAYDAFTTVLWIGGYFDEALNYMMKLYEACVEYYGELHQTTGTIALRVGAVYHNSLRFEKAKEWYLTALDILQKSEPCNSEYYYRIMSAAHKVARAERHEGHFDSAMKYLSTAEQAIETYRKARAGCAVFQKGEDWFVALEKAKTIAAMGETDKAAELCEEIEAEYQKEGLDRYHLLTELNILRAELFLKQGKPLPAQRLAQECFATIIAMRGENAKDTLSCQEILADSLYASGRIFEAEKLYVTLLGSLKYYYPQQKAWIQRAQEKEQAILQEDGRK